MDKKSNLSAIIFITWDWTSPPLCPLTAFNSERRWYSKGHIWKWPVPYGITMVSDMVSALLVTTTLLIALFVVWYGFGSITKERERFFYYPGIMFILTGVNGAFTTGDIFNLFVFFEVLLMASYLLIVLGGEKGQLKGSIKYILINVISSALFVITVAYLYSVVGTLNMADIAVKLLKLINQGLLLLLLYYF